MELEEEGTPNAKRRKSLKLQRPRFNFTTAEEVQDAQKGFVPDNTARATAWAMRVFRTWQAERNSSYPDDQCPENLLIDGNSDDICHWLSFFCKEVRKVNGDPYTPRTIMQILSGLHRHMREKRHDALNIMDSKMFPSLHRLLDSLFRELHREGVGASKQSAAVISFEEEEKLWETGVLNTETPSGLFNAVFYYNGLNFILRGGDEHRDLKISQLEFRSVPDPDNPSVMTECLVYTEHGSKNRPGGSRQLNLENKVVTQFAKPHLGERCHVQLIKKYLSKLPAVAFQKDIFYWKPKKFPTDAVSAEKPWYDSQPVGHNVLKEKLKVIFQLAGLSAESKTNHSLRATGITRLYAAGVPEKVIMDRSGHLSKEGVRGYERTTARQEKVVSNLLSTSSGNYMESLKQPERAPLQEVKPENNPKPDQPELRSKMDDELKMAAQNAPQGATPDLAAKREKMKEVFTMSGCNVTINMQF